MVGAKRDGATWFLAPADNCSAVAGHVPDGLRDVKVATLDEAYRALVAIGKRTGRRLAALHGVSAWNFAVKRSQSEIFGRVNVFVRHDLLM